MSYRNGRELLPPQLLREIQEYIQGEIIYIPCKESERAAWGAVNGTRAKFEERNREITRLYHHGITVRELAEKYFLSEDSIRKVLQKPSPECQIDIEMTSGDISLSG
jgi:Mor family transcriptional regulator